MSQGGSRPGLGEGGHAQGGPGEGGPAFSRVTGRCPGPGAGTPPSAAAEQGGNPSGAAGVGTALAGVGTAPVGVGTAPAGGGNAPAGGGTAPAGGGRRPSAAGVVVQPRPSRARPLRSLGAHMGGGRGRV